MRIKKEVCFAIMLLCAVLAAAAIASAAEIVYLDSASNPSQQIRLDSENYTVELVSASDSAATIKISNATGASETSEINEAAEKIMLGLKIKIIAADEANSKFTATVRAGFPGMTAENKALAQAAREQAGQSYSACMRNITTDKNICTLATRIDYTACKNASMQIANVTERVAAKRACSAVNKNQTSLCKQDFSAAKIGCKKLRRSWFEGLVVWIAG